MDAPAQCPPHPMTLCGGMTEFDEDYLNGWEVIWQDDQGFEHGLPPIFGNRGTNVVAVSPMDFFNFLFRDTMWGQIANQTNEYALQRQQRLGPDAVARMEHPDYKRFACQNLWKPVGIEDIRVFAAHLNLLGLIKKPELSDYWSHKELTRTPFFGTRMPRDRFQAILSNFHVADDQANPPTLTHNINLWPNCSHSLICVIHSSKQHSILAKTFPSMKDAVHGEAIFGSNNLIHENPISTTSKFFRSLTPTLGT